MQLVLLGAGLLGEEVVDPNPDLGLDLGKTLVVEILKTGTRYGKVSDRTVTDMKLPDTCRTSTVARKTYYQLLTSCLF